MKLNTTRFLATILGALLLGTPFFLAGKLYAEVFPSTGIVIQTAEAAPAADGEEVIGAEPAQSPARVRFLPEMQWETARSGWVEVGQDPTPRINRTFLDHEISLGGRPYARGIGTFPFSEITYALDGTATHFRAVAGVEDGPLAAGGSVRFRVFVDGLLLAETNVLRAGDAPVRLNVPVAGATQLRLVVTDGGDGREGDYAVWAAPRLVMTDRSQWESVRVQLAERVQGQEAQRRVALTAAQAQIEAGASADTVSVARAAGAGFRPGVTRGAFFDAVSQRLVVTNGPIAALLGFGGEENATLKLINLPSGSPVAAGLRPAITVDGAVTVDLPTATTPVRPDSYRLGRAADPGLGESLEVEATYRLHGSDDTVTIRARMAESFPGLTLQVEAPLRLTEPEGAALRYLDIAAGGALRATGVPRLITDYSQLREATLPDDGLLRREVVGLGKPVLLWSPEGGQGALLAVLDEVDLPARLEMRRDLGLPRIATTFEQPLARAADRLPRLYLEAITTGQVAGAFTHYRAINTRLYPPLPVPGWVKYQWLSWYVYFTEANEEDYRAQIDAIAEQFGDMGPWNIVIDAGWYITEGRPGADWRAVDTEKFPSGLRPIVEYAHERGIKVVLYFSSPYINDDETPGNWLGLRGLIDEHPDWLIPLPNGKHGERRYVYDYGNPDLRAYLAAVMEDFFVEYGVDGIKLDGLGGGEGQVLERLFSGFFDTRLELIGQSREIYRFTHDTIAALGVGDVFIESGWVTPVFAGQYAHMFRYGDEFPSFSHAYPWPGLKEHIDYAIYQHLIGQRANIGALLMEPNEDPLALSWLEASLALGVQATLSFDLQGLRPDTLSALRERLLPSTAFAAGSTRMGPGWLPDTFSTTVNGTTYLGILNRTSETREIQLNAQDYGLDPGQPFLVYVPDLRRFFVGSRGQATVRQPAHSFRLLVIRQTPGMMWTNSNVQVHEDARSLEVRVAGPPSIDGFVSLFVPQPKEVSVDGRVLAPERYEYDPGRRVLTVRYPHDQPHSIKISY